jgi:hypothetical protein
MRPKRERKRPCWYEDWSRFSKDPARQLPGKVYVQVIEGYSALVPLSTERLKFLKLCWDRAAAIGVAPAGPRRWWRWRMRLITLESLWLASGRTAALNLLDRALVWLCRLRRPLQRRKRTAPRSQRQPRSQPSWLHRNGTGR